MTRTYIEGARAEVVDSICREIAAQRQQRNSASARINDVTALAFRLIDGPSETDLYSVTTRIQTYSRINMLDFHLADPMLHRKLIKLYGRGHEYRALLIREKP